MNYLPVADVKTTAQASGREVGRSVCAAHSQSYRRSQSTTTEVVFRHRHRQAAYAIYRGKHVVSVYSMNARHSLH